MPTKILMGKNAVLKNKHEFLGYGKKALIVTGKNSAKITGALEDVTNTLKEMNIAYAIFDRIEENPCTKTIEEAASFGKTEEAEFIIGIGGGSPLDASKAIGIMIKNKHLTEETLFSEKKFESIPVLAVPTTAGTGSETTPYAILTDHRAKTKRNLGQIVFCKAAFLDAKYTEKAPYDITVNTALDAMTHLVEGYLNTNSTYLSDMLAEKGLTLWGECVPSLLEADFDFEIREKLMLASSIGGMAIANTGTSLPHGMGYALTYFKGVPHGLANALLFKAYLRCFENKSKVEKVYKLLGFGSGEEFEEFLLKMLHADIVVSREEIEGWSEAMCSNTAKLKNHPELVAYETIYNIYEQSLSVNKG
jgi:alcohol dehydrogenase